MTRLLILILVLHYFRALFGVFDRVPYISLLLLVDPAEYVFTGLIVPERGLRDVIDILEIIRLRLLLWMPVISKRCPLIKV